MGSFSTGLMLMGIALVYGATGTFNTTNMQAAGTELPALLIAGLMLLLFSMSFKVSAAPFHFWTPDVYDGSPTVFTSFMATVVKAAGFIGFLRLFDEAFGGVRPQWALLVAIITAITFLLATLPRCFSKVSSACWRILPFRRRAL
jgi:NADH-quinone oxidoreductase subunit N